MELYSSLEELPPSIFEAINLRFPKYGPQRTTELSPSSCSTVYLAGLLPPAVVGVVDKALLVVVSLALCRTIKRMLDNSFRTFGDSQRFVLEQVTRSSVLLLLLCPANKLLSNSLRDGPYLVIVLQTNSYCTQ